MESNDFLPIGTVVVLKNETDQLMIIGYKIKAKTKDKEVTSDYLACFHPQGIKGIETLRSFNKEDIDQIIDLGYINDYWIDFKNKVLDKRGSEE